MSYRARCQSNEVRRLRRQRRKWLRMEPASALMKWHYSDEIHPWWVQLSLSRRWVRSVREAMYLSEAWLTQWPPDRLHKHRFSAMYSAQRPFFAVLRKSDA